jgi:hypothetical protein
VPLSDDVFSFEVYGCPRVESNHHAQTGTGPQPAAYTIPPRGQVAEIDAAIVHIERITQTFYMKDCALSIPFCMGFLAIISYG